ncbi:MAG: hypothetical protein ACYDEX_22435 [Mobilitalea sp.]
MQENERVIKDLNVSTGRMDISRPTLKKPSILFAGLSPKEIVTYDMHCLQGWILIPRNSWDGLFRGWQKHLTGRLVKVSRRCFVYTDFRPVNVIDSLFLQ